MLAFLGPELATLLVAGLVFGAVAAIVGRGLWNKRHGKADGCGCGCGGCSGCDGAAQCPGCRPRN